MTESKSATPAPNDDGVRRLIAQLDRHAGLLGRDADAARLRTSVRALSQAVGRGDDPTSTVRTVEAHLSRMAPGGVTSVLRQTMRSLRAEVRPTRSLPTSAHDLVDKG